ncbi:MAG: DnaJ C-terminal domain-containing protein [Mariniblastus sp.]
MADDDYYKVLGVSKNASESEIQKAYRKLARKYHPDLHADADERERDRAKQQFQKVQQAYDVLSDAKKRQMYDQMGPGFEQMGGNPFGGGGSPFGGAGPGGIDISQIFGGGGGGGGFEDILRQMGGGPGGQMGGGRRGPTKGSDVEQEITVPFAVSVLGGQHQISLQRRNGKVEKIDIKIPAGIESNKKIRLRGQGQTGADGGPRGDLLVKVIVAPHPNYSRIGMNLKVTVPISILEAAEGAKIDLPTPHGTITVTVPAGSSSGKSLRLKGMGIKSKDRSGDLIANLQVTLPEEIVEEDVELLKQLSDAWSESTRNDLAW